VDRQTAFVVEEEHLNLPGVVVEVEALREYLLGPCLSHVLGYAGEMPAERMDYYLGQPSEDYELGDRVGLTGVELVYEEELRGRKGRKHVEVDAYEREINVLAVDPPEPGHSLVLTLDTEFQQAVETALRKGMREARENLQSPHESLCRSGVVVAMNPQSGEILAMVSLPSYDDNLLAATIPAGDLAALSSDPRHPLVNHATGGQYPPGSTFKPYVAAGALQEGTATTETKLACEGTLLLPNKYFPDDPELAQTFYCWREEGHGLLNTRQAIQHSCDIFFYQVAGGYEDYDGLGIEKLAEYARLFGYGEPTGIDLPGESSGLVPSDRWKRKTYGESWVKGDTYNAAIGQGFVLATPLQVVNSVAAIANFGTLYRPQVVHSVIDAEGLTVRSFAPDVIRTINVDYDHLGLIRQGMRDAVTQGTAWLLDVPEIPVAGKTGTAEYPGFDEQGNLILDEEGHLPTHAWFTAFAPYDDPEIALVVFVEGGGEGSQVAVPIAGEILRHYFGLPESRPLPASELPIIGTQ
jgi:penicillin-binding protein 2